MYVNVEAKALARAMKIANAVIDPRNTIPILSTVRLTYGPKGLTVEGTGLDIFVRISVDEIDGRGEWSTCINARFFAAIIAAAGVAPIRIEPTTQGDEQHTRLGVKIEHGYANYEVETLDPADFPDIMGDRAGRVERFTNGMFTAMLRKVAFCISTEETRYYLNGVCWQAQPGGKRFAATDGHRLALCRYADNDENASFSRIIPRKTVNFLMQHIDGQDIDVHQIVKGNAPDDVTLDFVAAGIEVRSKLIDGTFPDIDRVVPKESAHTLKLNRDEVLQAIKQAQAVSSERARAVRFHELEGRLHVETKNPEFGNAKIKTSTAWPEGAPSFGVNGRYAAEVIGHCQGAVTLGMTDGSSPFLISDDDKDMTRVCMPMRV